MKKIGFLILMVLVLIGCDDDNDEQERCLTKATLRDFNGKLDGCGWVFELEDGTRLEPVIPLVCGTPPLPKEITEDPLYNFEFVDGKEVLINYEPIESVNICMVGPAVKITCITEIPATISAE